MYPVKVHVLGATLSAWDLAFLAGVAAGYVVLRQSFALGQALRRPRLLALRWLVTVYVSAIGAQLFAYAFDRNTTLLPPDTVSWAAYYLVPFGRPKVLYGAILFLPVGLVPVSLPWRDLGWRQALERWTPAMMAVLAAARTGCLLEGCCYGRRSDLLGLRFAAGSVVANDELHAGLIAAGKPTLPVVPTQLLSALALVGLCLWSRRAIRRGEHGVFVTAVALYSAFRLSIEFLRADPVRNAFGPLSTSQWFALGVLVVYGGWRGWAAWTGGR